MDDALFRTILEAGGVSGTILGVAWILRAVLLKWLDNLAASRKYEAEREKGELEQSRRLETALNGMVAELALSRQVNLQFAARFEALPTRLDFEQIGVTMRDWAHKHDNDVDKIPAKVWELSEEPLEELKKEIIAALEACLNEKTDFEAIRAQLSELLKLIKAIQEATEKKTDDKPKEA